MAAAAKPGLTHTSKIFVPPVRSEEPYHHESVCDSGFPTLLQKLNVKAAKGHVTAIIAQLKKCRNARDKQFDDYKNRDYNHVQAIELMNRLLTLIEKELPIEDGTPFQMGHQLLQLMPSTAPDRSQIFFEPQICTITLGGVTYHTFPVFFLYHGQGTFSVYNPYSHRHIPRGYTFPEWVTPSYKPEGRRPRTPSPPPHAVPHNAVPHNATRKKSPNNHSKPKTHRSTSRSPKKNAAAP